MSSTITSHDGIILTRHAKRGDVEELRRTLNHLAQREGPSGMDRADILLLAKDEAGNNVVHSACTYDNTNILEFVYGLNEFALKPGVLRSITNARNNVSDTPIHKAAQNHSLDCARAILQRGAEINAVGSFGLCVAHFASRDRHPQMLRYVLQHGADTSPVSISGDTPAHFAARNRDLYCLRALHQAGAGLRGYNMAGETPANIAERLSNEEMMIWMRERNIF